jgi:hypothetical protein
MIWKLRKDDVLKLTGEICHYKVTDMYGCHIILENCLTHEKKDIFNSELIDGTVIR